MIRRMTRWVSDGSIEELGKSGLLGIVLTTPNEVMKHPITIEYEDGKPEPQPAARERVVETVVYVEPDGKLAARPGGGNISTADRSAIGTHGTPPGIWCAARLIITEPVRRVTCATCEGTGKVDEA